MKKCPNCERTFEDSLKFCQIDGTPLVDAAEMKSEDSFKTLVSSLISDNENLPKPANEFPSPSPFDNPSDSPFDASTPSFKEPETMFDEQRMPFNKSPFGNSPSTPFGNQAESYNPPMQQTEWTPPPAPVSEWQNQNIGANTPFQSPPAQSQNQTLPIISLVLGIISVACCWLGFLTGPAALITGYMGRNNADNNPAVYSGSGLALAGMITGGIGTLISVGYFVLIIIGIVASPR